MPRHLCVSRRTCTAYRNRHRQVGLLSDATWDRMGEHEQHKGAGATNSVEADQRCKRFAEPISVPVFFLGGPESGLSYDTPAAMDPPIPIVFGNGLATDLDHGLNIQSVLVKFESSEVGGKIDHATWTNQRNHSFQ